MTDTPAAADLDELRPLLKRRDQIRAQAAGVVTEALRALADNSLNDRSTRATIVREYGLRALGAILTVHLIVRAYGLSLTQAYGEDGAKRILAALRGEAVRVVAAELTAMEATTTQVPVGIDLRQQCTRCGEQPGRYATDVGLLCGECRDLLYPSDAVPAGGDAA